MKDTLCSIAFAASVLVSPLVFAHHGSFSRGALYHTEELVVLEGQITEVLWRNPHTRARLAARGDDGQEVIWELEFSPNPTEFQAIGIYPKDLEGRVRAAGYVSRRNEHSLGVLNLLLPNGLEFAANNQELMWSEQRVSNEEHIYLDPAKVAEARRTANGVFRVWGRRLGRGPEVSDYEDLLTDWARERAGTYNEVTDNTELECRTGMPLTMFDPVPMQFIDNGDHIVIRVWEHDVRRIVHMDDSTEPAGDPAFGYSVGRWDGDTLVVTTKDVDYPYFDEYGTPQSDDMVYTERFELSDDEAMLNYTLTATDPNAFTAPVVLKVSRRWTPGVELTPFNCVYEWKQ